MGETPSLGYRTLKWLYIIFVVFWYLTLLLVLIVVFTDGTDGIDLALKIASIPVLAFLAWIIAETPRQLYFYIAGTHGFDRPAAKAKLIAGILVTGLIFISAVVIVFPVGHQAAFTVTDPGAAGSPRFIQTLAALTNTPIEHGETVTPINDGSRFLPLLLSAMDSASSSIDFTTFPWADGTFNDQVFAALIAAERRGVQVRLLLDAFGSHSLSKTDIYALEAAGGKVAEYHTFNIMNPLQYDSRDHIRSIVIDGTLGFTGGMGITDEWFGSPPDLTFQDMMFEFRGEMAQSVQNSFSQIWTDTTGEALAGPLFYPPLPATTTANTFVGITSIPSGDYEPVRDSFLLTALSARKSLYIAASYIIPDQDLLSILEAKARAGVDVRIVSPGPTTVAPLLRAAWHIDYAQLLKAGVKLYEYQPSMIHTKIMIADGVWSLVGSANVDNRSETLNAENLLGIADLALAASLQQTYMGYIAQSKEFTLADWQKQYGFFSHLYSRILLCLDKQF